MGLTNAERARLAVLWRELALAAEEAASDPRSAGDLKGAAHDALNWGSPLEHFADAFVLFGLARLAAAFSKARTSELTERAGSLAATAVLAQQLLARDGAVKPLPPPQLPFRKDLDG